MHHLDQIGFPHGCERMRFHAGFGQQHIADKQMAFEDGAPVVREGGRGDGEIHAHCLHQSLRHGADVAALVAAVSAIQAIKGGAILEVNLLATGLLQPV